MDEILVVSLMSEKTRPAHRALVALLAERAGLALRFVDGPAWEQQLALLDRGEAQAAFICGLAYTRRDHALAAVAAPVQAGERYGGLPIYFADLVVRASSPWHALGDLRGVRVAYNEPGSFSGYAMLLAHLAARGERAGFFRAAVESGSHLDSLRLVLAGEADAAAIDSTVLDLIRRDDPALAAGLRKLATLGPYPAPAFAVVRALPPAACARLGAALVRLHADPAGRAILDLAAIERFVPVEDADYEPIRRAAVVAKEVRLT